MHSERTLLVSAGEASGDRIAALAIAALGGHVRAFGMAGTGCRAAGMNVLVSLCDVATMGWLPVARRAYAIGRAFRVLRQAQRRLRPRTALLVGFTSFNQLLGKHLRTDGVRVVWCVAPQVWAWRPSRLLSLRDSVDRLAVILPFEQEIWGNHGYDVRYVGHPAMDVTRTPSNGSVPRSVVVLPGSRAQEVRATAPAFLSAAQTWCERTGWSVRCVVANSLPVNTERWLRARCKAQGIPWTDADPLLGAAPLLHKHGLALCASGTASLEAAIAGATPIVGYRCDPITAAAARLVIRTPHIALPNILLQKRAFPELMQQDLCVDRLVDTLDRIENEMEASKAHCARIRSMLGVDDGKSFGDRLAAMLS